MPSNLFVRATLEVSDLNGGKVTALSNFIDSLMDRIEALEAVVKIHSIDFHKIVPLEARVLELETRPSGIDQSDIEDRIRDLEIKADDLENEMGDKLDKSDFDECFAIAMREVSFTVSADI